MVAFSKVVYGNTIDEMEVAAQREAEAFFGCEYDVTVKPFDHVGSSYGAREGKYMANARVTGVKRQTYGDMEHTVSGRH